MCAQNGNMHWSPTTAFDIKFAFNEWTFGEDKEVTPVLRAGEFDLLTAELRGTHYEDVRVARDSNDALNAILRLVKFNALSQPGCT